VVPVLASVVVIGEYIQRRVLGLTPFKEDGKRQFVAPEETQVPRRKWSKKERRERLGSLDESDSPEPASAFVSESVADENLVEEKTEE